MGTRGSRERREEGAGEIRERKRERRKRGRRSGRRRGEGVIREEMRRERERGKGKAWMVIPSLSSPSVVI